MRLPRVLLSAVALLVVIALATHQPPSWHASAHLEPRPTPSPSVTVDPTDLAAGPATSDSTPSHPTPSRQEHVIPPPEPARLEKPMRILLLGTDKRPDEPGPCRTDTMILLSIDGKNNTASMLSIPRDLWVPIPGHRSARINTAHFLGQVHNGQAGGPALAMRTVENLLGVPIDHYVRINFDGLRRVIDLVGGIDIGVEKAIHDTRFPDENFGYMTIDIPAGWQTMDGETVLRYVRTRHGGSDFQRVRRQQEVLKALRDKALALDIPLSRIPALIGTLGDTVQTDLSLRDILSIAQAAREIPSSQITAATIDEKMARPHINPDGNDVLMPDYDRIRDLAAQLFGPEATASALPTPSVHGDS